LCCQNTNNSPRPAGLLPRLDTGGITSAVVLAISEEKERDKRKLNGILHNLTKPISEDGNCRRIKILNRSLISCRKI